jgi:peptidylprolyl isomerase
MIRKLPALALALVLSGLSGCGMFGGDRARPGPEPVGIDLETDPFGALLPWSPARRDVQSTSDGVQYVAIRRGDPVGAHPGASDQVKLRYDARLAADGRPIEATRPGEPATFRLADLVPGLSAGIQRMVPGDQFMFFVPAGLAYGTEAAGPIPPNSDLVFLATLEAITIARTADAAAWSRAMPWNSASPDVRKTGSGLEYIIVRSGPAEGQPPADADTAVVHYEGRLDGGQTFDSSYPTGQPARFPVSRLIPGFTEALKLMRPGDRWMIRIPPQLAYGERGAGGVIPPNSPLTFELELESVEKAG